MILRYFFPTLLFAFTLHAQPSVTLDQEALANLEKLTLEAARQGDTKTIASYLQSGFDANITTRRGDTPLILAAYYGHAETVAAILKHPAAKVDLVNKMGFTALTGSAFQGHDAVTKALIKGGANVNATNASGQTPLMFAAMFGRTSAVKLLVAAGADPSLRNQQGQTAADLAATQGNEEMVALLARLGDGAR